MHREYVIDDTVYGETRSVSLEEMRRVMKGLQDAQLDILRFSINPPGWSTADIEALKESR
jgi:hypothetical protein